MRRERRQPTKSEFGRITSPGLVIRKIRLPKQKTPRAEDHQREQRERAMLIRVVIAKGAAEMMWGTRFEVDYGLRWDSDRQV